MLNIFADPKLTIFISKGILVGKPLSESDDGENIGEEDDVIEEFDESEDAESFDDEN